MQTYKPYSVVVVPFPFVDSPKTKNRPALVISTLAFQQKNDSVACLMITSASHSDWYGDVLITDLKQTGLASESVVRQKVFSIDSRLIKRTAGKLSAKDHQAVSKILKKHLAS